MRTVEHHFANALSGFYIVEFCRFHRRCGRLAFQTRKAILKDDDVVIIFGHFGGKAAELCRAQGTKVRWR